MVWDQLERVVRGGLKARNPYGQTSRMLLQFGQRFFKPTLKSIDSP